jgi:outer membrane protein
MRFAPQTVFNLLMAAGLVGLYVLYLINQPPNLAYVESAKVLEGYKDMQAARVQYRKQADTWQADLDTLKQTVQQELNAYNRVRATLSPEQRQTQEARLTQRQKQYFDYKKAITQKAADEEARLTGEVVRKADVLMKQYGKEHGYDIVFAATEAGTVVYGREGRDITAEVIQAINK